MAYQPTTVSPRALLETLLDVSLTGVILFRPVYDDAGAAIVDLAYEYLNPAAQQMLQLSEQPGESFLTLYPSAATQEGVFDFYCATFLSGQQGRHQFNYQYDGLDGYFHLVAQRQGPLLVVSFTDTNDQPRTAVEEALRASQAREQNARAEAELQRQYLHNVLTQAPAMICIFDGPQHTFQFVNPPYQALVGERPLVGKPIAQAMPELAGQPIFGLLDQVYQTGETFTASEMLVQLDHHNEGLAALEQRYYTFIYQARHSLTGEVDGILVFAYDVTPQVRARQQVQDLNEELATLNEELQTSNEEYLLANTALASAQQELQALNQELEARVTERTDQLRKQQELLQQILQQAPAAIATLSGPDHRFSFANARYQELVGYRVRMGQPVAEALPEVQEQGVIDVLDHVYQTGKPFTGREIALMLEQPPGPPHQYYYDLTYLPLRDGQDQVQGLLAFSVEVTEQVRRRREAQTLQANLLAQAQRQAQERQDLYQVFSQTPALVLLLRGPEHRIDYLNEAAQRLFPGRHLQGRTIAESQPEAATQGFVALLDRVYQTGETHLGAEVPLSVLDEASQLPRTTYLNFSYQAYHEQGAIAGVSVFAYDVTAQVLAREQREAQQRQLTDVFAQAPVAVCLFRGPDYVLDIVNPSMGEMLGRSPASLVGQPFFEALPELADQGLRELLDEVRRTGIPYVAQEQPIHLGRHAAGEVGYFNFVYQPLRDDNGQLTAIICVATELTEQVQARYQVQSLNEELAAINEELMATNEELHESNRRLTRTNNDLDTFVYTASHDLKAPIANIEGILLALREQLSPAVLQNELVAQLLEMLQGTISRFQLTISQLTDVTKLQLAHVGPAEPVPLAMVVEAVRLDLVPVLQAAATRLLIEVDADIVISFSPANLRSIVYNLLSNAVKYRDPARPSVVRMWAERHARAIVLHVQDNGLGLSELQQRQLFGLFQRLHTHVEGTGVGLYIVKRLVENAGGTITVASQPHVGTTFTVIFPLTA